MAAPRKPRSPSEGGAAGPSRVTTVIAICTAAFIVGFFLGTIRSERDALKVDHKTEQAAAREIAALSERVFADTKQQSSQREQAARAASQVPKGPTTCTNTCSKANNGVCEDGTAVGKGQRNVFCDLGTDCADCGPFVGPLPGNTWPEGGPVKHLLAKDVPLFTRVTATTPPFQVMYTDPTKDLDVSEMLDRTGLLESGITAIFRMVLEHHCVDPATGKRKLVLDVGANFGYFSVYAAMMGCRVIAWEPIPHFRAILEHLVSINKVGHLVTVRGKVVSAKDGELITMQVPTKGVWGTASVSGINQYDHQKPVSLNVTSERVDSVVDEDVLLMKVDVEGFESVVFNSAARLLSKRVVEHVVFEYNPGLAEMVAQRQPQFEYLLEANPNMLLSMLKSNFKIGMMLDHIAKGALFPPNGFPALPEVTAARLRYDLEDAATLKRMLKNMQANKNNPGEGMTCPIKPELLALNPEWGGCMRTPEDVHPKSLRSAFPYNANLWASREGKLLRLDGVAGAMGADQDASKVWFIKTDGPEPFAMASRSCRYLPAAMLVRNRCSCDWSVKQGHAPADVEKCRAEEKMVLNLFGQGRFKFTDYEFLPYSSGSQQTAASSAS